MFVDMVVRLVCGLGNAVSRLQNFTAVPRLELLACIFLSKLIVSVVECSKCILLVRFTNFTVVGQTSLERL